MLLSYNELRKLVERNVIEGVDLRDVNGTSIDIHLGNTLLVEQGNDHADLIVDIMKRTNFQSKKVDITNTPYDMRPGEFLLAHTIEKFNLPNNISAEFRLKSSGARSGLQNSFACHCDPGWYGSTLTLELKNYLQYHKLRLTYGMAVGQMLFHIVEPVPADKDYAARGRYCNDASVQEVKL